ncbi:TetR/AcrR family transcriptional regulator [Saccharospirillum salsuginis]|uniref:HTH tetR-type domain-containing protein n=1 Tax=Saccharospirillum salsuginis TaxID=418750 RepID=A0A918KM10_9GAMM|nr:TetR/AcrR family transcriptional regulator [Saccharospirillum salsuginis]GGX68772.1 hypothetical protein GCM10007392_40510 [Saccharospirillum salsuginis]
MTRNAKQRKTRDDLLSAAGTLLREVGYGGLSTRKVAETAGVPLSQIHYHFGSMQGLLLALLEVENDRLLDRQTAMYESDRPLSEKWVMACRYLHDDLESGYVRVLHEMMYAALSDVEIRHRIQQQLDGWKDLLTSVAQQAIDRYGPIGPFTAGELGILVGQSFLGLETLLLLDAVKASEDGYNAICKIGGLIAEMERRAGDG